MDSCKQGEVLVGDLICFPQDPTGFMTVFYAVGLSIVGMISLLFLIYGGYVIMISRGSPSDVRKGKSYVFYALVGLFVAVFGYVIVEVVFVDILQIPGFGR